MANSMSENEDEMAENDSIDDAHPSHDTLSEDVKLNAPLPRAIRRIPCFFRFDNVPPEATGLSLDAYARGVVLMSSLFMGPALLTLANEEAQASCDSRGEDARIYGMKPSSLLSYIAIVTGVLTALILPLFGAIVDHTPYRRQVGLWSAFVLLLIKGAETAVSSRTWVIVAVLQIVSGSLYYVHTSATWAYTSELTDNHKQQASYNTYYFIVLYVSTLIFLGQVLVLAFSLHTDDVGTARISQAITFVTSSIFFGIAWKFLFRNRPALSKLPEGSTLLKCGFQRLQSSSRMIRQDLTSLKWLMLAITSSESATAALITIATTYMSHFLQMSANEIGIVFLSVLIMGAPGSKLGEVVALRLDALVSAKACTIFFILSTSLASVLLTSPRDKHLTPIFGICWGLALGWLHPMHSTLFITITPAGQETELMSLYLFCGQVLSWLPPLLFTILNEMGVSMSIGLASLNVFFAIGLACLHNMGSYNVARDQALLRRDLVPSDEHTDGSDTNGGEESLPPIL
jgi:MFS-type transporter involved in bile tolerance (Atg22 family)